MHRKKQEVETATVSDLIIAVKDDAERVKLLSNHYDDAARLLKTGFTVDQLAKLPLERLELFFNVNLAPLMRVLTIEQLVRAKPSEVAFPKGDHEDSNEDPYCYHDDEHNLKYWRTTFREKTTEGQSLEVIDVFKMKEPVMEDGEEVEKAETRLKIVSAEVKKALPALNAAIKNVMPVHLVTDWYVVAHEQPNKDKQLTRVLYSPDRQEIHSESYDNGFPLNELTTAPINPILSAASYYRERRFLHLLAEHGMTLENLAGMKGMTKWKVLLLCDFEADVAKLLKLGVTFEDLAKVSIKRMGPIFAHVDLESALRVVGVRDLLGLDTVSVSQCKSVLHAHRASPFVDLADKLDSHMRNLAHPTY